MLSLAFFTGALLVNRGVHKHSSLNKIRRRTTASAPGKVLITGGYLVLENDYSGLVLASSSRFYSHVGSVSYPAKKRTTVHFHSPQFHSRTSFTFVHEEPGILRLERAADASENKYVEFSLLYSLAVAGWLSEVEEWPSVLEVKVEADNDFYSQRQNLKDAGKDITLKSLKELPKCYAPSEKKEIHKTGLGSSAAMVTSLVTAILAHFNSVDVGSPSGRELVHRVAQFVHCLAQGKVGSGFDVSAAAFGSQKYTRFNSKILQRCLDTAEAKNKNLNHVICDNEMLDVLITDLDLDTLRGSNIGNKWNHKNTLFQLPTGFNLFVADVDQGSNTPSMVRSVLQWKSDNKVEATQLWNSIDSLNNGTEQLFNELHRYSEENTSVYEVTLANLNGIPYSAWRAQYTNKSSLEYRIADCMSRLRETFIGVRKGMKLMGDNSQVPIEPEEQTKLLDATMDVNGCLISGVPGAGGFDAIFCILFGDEETTKSRVEHMWLNYKGADVCPLLLGESNSKGVVVVNHTEP